MNCLKYSIGFLSGILLLLSGALQANWSSPPANLSLSGEDANEPQVAIDPAGNAVAVWERSNGSRTVIQAAVLSSGSSSWTTTSDLSNASFNATVPQVAVDAAGNAVAVWVIQEAVRIVQSATLPFGSNSWIPATANLSLVGNDGTEPQVAVDAAGNATAVWTQFTGGFDIIYAAVLPAGSSTWSGGIPVSPAGQNSTVPQIAVDPAGNAVVIWFNGVNSDIEGAVSYYGSNTWTATGNLSSSIDDETPLQLGVDAAGNAVATWTFRLNANNSVIQAATLPFGSLTWVPATANLSVIGHIAQTSQLAVSPSGNAIAVWVLTNASYSLIQGATLAAGSNTWVPTTNLSLPSQGTGFPRIGVDGMGNATAIWYQLDPILNYIVQGAYLPFGSSIWSAAANISASSGSSSDTGLAVNHAGEAVAVWAYDNGNLIIQASVNSIPPAPSSFQGNVVKNRFLTQTDVIHILSWNPSPDPSIVGYRIYQGGVLVSQTPATGPYSVTLHNRHKKPYTYILVSVNAAGGESYPLTLTLQ